ncbi:hypothetical protein [Sphingobacterium faecium]|uniref:hypothetical protein n=1 Tax=Sphingobacterium faecium TaxID=34087 RepID=UPI0024698641|nr:hypothetical protein [Sphingobacterium faecium]MDH5825769.1 hypothetical protein [Sphingobacterium faecium]
MDISQAVRTAVFQALSPIVVDNKVIPVFDGMVNPLVSLPVIRGGTCYILLQDQQEVEAPNQTMCGERILANQTVKVVVKFNTANVTDRSLCDQISSLVKTSIRPNRDHTLSSNEINIQKVGFPISRNTEEFGATSTALSKVLIYSITVNN